MKIKPKHTTKKEPESKNLNVIEGYFKMLSADYRKYKSKNPIVQFLLRGFLSSLVELARLTKARTILDAGCGEGFLTNHLSSHYKMAQITGIDYSSEAIDKAKKLNPSLKFYEGNIYNLSFPDDSYDLIICSEVLEHLEEPERAIEELKRVTKKYCIISVPHEPFFQLGTFLRGKHFWRLGNNPEHIQNWTKKQFLSLMERHLRIAKIVTPFPWVIILGAKNVPGHAR